MRLIIIDFNNRDSEAKSLASELEIAMKVDNFAGRFAEYRTINY